MKNRGTAVIVIYLAASIILLWLAPAEQTLGQWIKVIYFHVALSYAGIYAIYAAGILGVVYLLTGRTAYGRWSGEIGRSAIFIWFISVVLSLVSMLVWGGLFWAEPRTIAALTMLVIGVGKEGITLRENLKFRAAANIAFALAVLFIRSNLTRVMHPDSPIRASESLLVKAVPVLLLLFTLAVLIEITRRRLYENPQNVEK